MPRSKRNMHQMPEESLNAASKLKILVLTPNSFGSDRQVLFPRAWRLDLCVKVIFDSDARKSPYRRVYGENEREGRAYYSASEINSAPTFTMETGWIPLVHEGECWGIFCSLLSTTKSRPFGENFPSLWLQNGPENRYGCVFLVFVLTDGVFAGHPALYGE